MNVMDATQNLGLPRAIEDNDTEALAEIGRYCHLTAEESFKEAIDLAATLNFEAQLAAAELCMQTVADAVGEDHLATKICRIGYLVLQNQVAKAFEHDCAQRIHASGKMFEVSAEWLPNKPPTTD